MPIPTRTEQLDQLYTSTWQIRKKDIADNAFDAMPFYFWLKDNGKIRREQGGRFIEIPLMYNKNETVAWVTKGSKVTIADTEHITVCHFDWKAVTVGVIRYGADDQKNRGKVAEINLLNSKIENAKNSLIDELERALLQDPSLTPDSMEGVYKLVQSDPTVSDTIGNLNQATYTWWRNRFKPASGAASVTLKTDMKNLLNTASRNMRQEKPDIILTDQTSYELYEDEVLEQKQIVNQKLGDAMFENIQFKGIPLVWSPQTTAGYMYFLNTKYIELVIDSGYDFEMTEWKAIPDQVNDRVAQIICYLNMTVSRRLCQALLYGIVA